MPSLPCGKYAVFSFYHLTRVGSHAKYTYAEIFDARLAIGNWQWRRDPAQSIELREKRQSC